MTRLKITGQRHASPGNTTELLQIKEDKKSKYKRINTFK